MSSRTETASPATPILPGAPGYDEARLAWNRTADLRPAAIAVTRSSDDIRDALGYAHAHGLRVAPMTTGHMGPSMPPLDDTLLLRFGEPGVEVDAAARVARVRAGTPWRQVIAAVAPHGLTAMHGTSPSVGVIGYHLGGGLSFYSRRHGLAANHVRAFTVMTADGEVRRVDADHDPDLFWALRGGGGPFVVVVSLEIELLPYTEVRGGSLFFAPEDAERVLRGWRDWTRTAPDTVTSTFRTISIPDVPPFPQELRGVRALRIDAVALDADDAAAFEGILREVATPTAGEIRIMSAAAVTRVNDDPDEPLEGIGGGGSLLTELDDAAIDAFLEVTGEDSPLFVAELRHLGGALAEAPPGGGLRSRLEGQYVTLVGGSPGVPAPTDQLRTAIRDFLSALEPWSAGVRFGPFAIEDGVTIEQCLPAEALPRLVAIREEVDPEHLFLTPHGLR